MQMSGFADDAVDLVVCAEDHDVGDAEVGGRDLEAEFRYGFDVPVSCIGAEEEDDLLED